MSKYPEHDKLKKISKEQLDILNEFEEFLFSYYSVLSFETQKHARMKEPIARFLEIDLDKYGEEEKEMYRLCIDRKSLLGSTLGATHN